MVVIAIKFQGWIVAVVVQSSSCVWLFVTVWTAAHKASQSSIIFQSLLKLMFIDLVMLSISSSAIPFTFCLQSLPASGSFPRSQLFASGGHSIGASASALVLPRRIQDWLPLRWTGLISLRSKGPSGVFFCTTVPERQFFGLCLLYGPALTPVRDYWKDNSLDYTDFCWQSDVFAF